MEKIIKCKNNAFCECKKCLENQENQYYDGLMDGEG